MLSEREDNFRGLAVKLFEIGAIKFGDFKMKVGVNSPVYLDLRVIVSFPDVMTTVVNLIDDIIKEHNIQYKHVCGVPYMALPVATLVAMKNKQPMLVRRKEPKSYGTKKIIEGKFNAGEKCLVIEDVTSSGSSILETTRDLRAEGLVVSDAIVMVEREQGAILNSKKNGMNLIPIFTLSHLLKLLQEAEKIDEKIVESVKKFINSCQIHDDGTLVDPSRNFVNELSRTTMSFEARSELAQAPLAKKLFNIMIIKQSNLCVAADLSKADHILNIADICGPYICILKTHCDIIEDFSENFIQSLQMLSKKHNFLIMEDRKFADIGNTVYLQYTQGLYKISKWADIVTVHALPGQSILQGLKTNLDQPEKRGVFLLAEMSSQGNLINEKYKEATIKLATDSNDSDFVAGIVCQTSDCFSFPGLIQLTPGVRIENSHDDLGQQYQSPEDVVKIKGADIGVVGRGIYEAKCIDKACILYRDRLWAAYCDRIESNH
ncbi:uridine 5'-monophosphate synthase [Condylostylus longicornis]|uniref:uridine 5'-monophosphate synthase n=1 Tax=Condylostylus longicornis TaxID=2530218 RepID=UPI00244DAD64|nr:uridine 5'-monophosphate synthase [Condylostylus longicornis]